LQALTLETIKLIDQVRCTGAPAEALLRCHEHIAAAIAVLDPWKQVCNASVDGLGMDVAEGEQRDINQLLPFSPISGSCNPVAPPVVFRLEGDEVRGEVSFSSVYAGPPNTVHGGTIAGLFDELLSIANIANGKAAYTGSLTIKYHAPTPLNTKLDLYAFCLSRSGRKVKSRGEMRCNGVLTASAEGLFIVPRQDWPSLV
jgi:acyl-coenzyme A thioesterase PaaI-like protein